VTHPVVDHLPAPARAAVSSAWQRLNADQRRDLEQWLPGAGNISGVRDIIDYITQNYRTALDQTKANIVIVGPANVGKSTLYNQLVVPQEAKAVVSPVPGTTRVNQSGSAGLFAVIDTPGADRVGPTGDRERDYAFAAARDADFLIILFDAESGIRKSDRELFDALMTLNKPHVIVLNKMDLIRKGERDRVLDSAAENLDVDRLKIIDISASRGDHVGSIVLAIAQAEPRLLISLADALPAYRSKLAWQRTIQAATAAGSIALIPLPVADMIPLLGVQTGLILTIARIYGFDITIARAKELIAAFGLGFLARSAYRQLAKLLGAPGWVLSAAVAAAATVAIGYASMVWFERGERPAPQALQKMMNDVAAYLRDALLKGGKDRPDQKNFARRIQAALEGLPDRFRPGSDRSPADRE
jgi:GTP-binding protein Era